MDNPEIKIDFEEFNKRYVTREEYNILLNSIINLHKDGGGKDMNKYSKALEAIWSNCSAEFYKTAESQSAHIILQNLIERQIPKEPREDEMLKDTYVCPECNHILSTGARHRFCEYCGQALDWSDIDEKN